MRDDVKREALRLANLKLADRYINRSGGPPSLRDRKLAARTQDLMHDDRRHLRFCVQTIADALQMRLRKSDDVVYCAWDFIEAILDRDYGLSLGEDKK